MKTTRRQNQAFNTENSGPTSAVLVKKNERVGFYKLIIIKKLLEVGKKIETYWTWKVI